MLFIRIFFPKNVMLYSHELLTYVRRVLIVFDWKMYAAQWHGKKAKTSIMFSHISWKWSFTTVLTFSNYPSWVYVFLTANRAFLSTQSVLHFYFVCYQTSRINWSITEGLLLNQIFLSNGF